MPRRSVLIALVVLSIALCIANGEKGTTPSPEGSDEAGGPGDMGKAHPGDKDKAGGQHGGSQGGPPPGKGK